jgi:hypothetical protein
MAAKTQRGQIIEKLIERDYTEDDSRKIISYWHSWLVTVADYTAYDIAYDLHYSGKAEEALADGQPQPELIMYEDGPDDNGPDGWEHPLSDPNQPEIPF